MALPSHDASTAVPAWLNSLLVCPVCRQEGLHMGAGESVQCQCGAAYPVSDGVVSLLAASERSDLDAKPWRLLAENLNRLHISHDDWVELPTHPLERAQLDWIIAALEKRGRCRVLDLGAGRGWASRALAAAGHQVVAVDALADTEIGLGCAAQQAHAAGVEFGCVQAAVEDLPFSANQFDAVVSFGLLPHIVDLDRVFREVARVLRPGGVFLALGEPFRGELTTHLQRFQDRLEYLVARLWQIGSLPGTVPAALAGFRASLGSRFRCVCRRAAYYRTVCASAGLDCQKFPAEVFLAQTPDIDAAIVPTSRSWLPAFARHHEVDLARFESLAETPKALAAWIAYWTDVSNSDGVLLARKSDGPSRPTGSRELDRPLLATATRGFVPVYGVYPFEGTESDGYHWIKPEAGFLIPAAEAVDLTMTAAAAFFRSMPARLEVYVEAQPLPRLVGLLEPGKTVTWRIPLRGIAAPHGSLLLRLRADLGFIPTDYDADRLTDGRLLAAQVRSIRVQP